MSKAKAISPIQKIDVSENSVVFWAEPWLAVKVSSVPHSLIETLATLSPLPLQGSPKRESDPQHSDGRTKRWGQNLALPRAGQRWLAWLSQTASCPYGDVVGSSAGTETSADKFAWGFLSSSSQICKAVSAKPILGPLSRGTPTFPHRLSCPCGQPLCSSAQSHVETSMSFPNLSTFLCSDLAC